MISTFKYLSPIAEAYSKMHINESDDVQNTSQAEKPKENGSKMSDSERILYYQDRIRFAERELQRLTNDKRYVNGKGQAIGLLKQSIENSKRKIAELEQKTQEQNIQTIQPQVMVASVPKSNPNTSISESFYPDALNDIDTSDTYSILSEFEQARRKALGHDVDPQNFGDDVEAYTEAVKKDLQKLYELSQSGQFRMEWELIDPEQYKNALTSFIRDGDMFRFSPSIIRGWLELVLKNVMLLEETTSLSGHEQHCDIYGVRDFYFDDSENDYGELFIPDDFEKFYDFLYNRGFDFWCKLPDGTDAISDYGIRPILKILSSLPDEPTPSESIVALNRCLDVVHQRGDLASAFIKGGSNSLAQISNESTELSKSLGQWVELSEAVERPKSENIHKIKYGGLDEQFPLLSDGDCDVIVDIAEKYGLAKLWIIGQFYKIDDKSRLGRNRKTYSKIGYVKNDVLNTSASNGQKIPFDDAITEDIENAVLLYPKLSSSREEISIICKNTHDKIKSAVEIPQGYDAGCATQYLLDKKEVWGLSPIVEKSIEIFEKNGYKALPNDIVQKIVNGRINAYGRNRDEVRLENSVLQQISKMGDSLGLDVDVDYGDLSTEGEGGEIGDEGMLENISFKELNAIKHLLKFISSNLFHKTNIKPIQMTTEGQKDFLENKSRQVLDMFKNGKARYYQGTSYAMSGNDWNSNKERGMKSSAEMVNTLDDCFANGFANGARIISGQNDSIDTPFDKLVPEDLSMLIEHVKDGYHTGVHWGSGNQWFYDRGDWVEGMSYFVLNGKIPLNSVNFAETASTRYEFTNENELWLLPGKPIFEPSISYHTNRLVLYIKPKDSSKIFVV